MKKYTSPILLSVIMFAAVFVSALFVTPLAHAAANDAICQGAGGCGQGLSVGRGFGIITNILIFLVGATAVIFLIIGRLSLHYQQR